MNTYDLKDFNNWNAAKVSFPITKKLLEIEEDPFFHSDDFVAFERFKKIRGRLILATENGEELSDELLTEFVSTNPNYYETYRLLGNYHLAVENFVTASKNYKSALTQEIAYQEDRVFIEEQLAEINSKTND
jgi:hypothetical protein